MKVRAIIICVLATTLAPCPALAAIALDSGDYLSWSTAPASSTPLTMYCRFWRDDINNDPADAATFVSIAESGNHSDAASRSATMASRTSAPTRPSPAPFRLPPSVRPPLPPTPGTTASDDSIRQRVAGPS
jgi:hypothetical protein